ncbi:putative DNA-binding domain-containing protein [Oxalobacteraceae bacterium]|nr:putative DNA-binding domain-containing protein [Oxalobacteraceae bacterium]
MSALLAIQSDFQDYVLGQAGARPAIATQVREQYGLNAADRLAIYYKAYRIRMREALSEAFDKTWSYIGDEMFDGLAASYLAAHPSQHRNLRWFGGEFPAHAARAYPDHPYIAELARFEWSLGIAFDAADAECIGMAALRAVAPEQWGGLAFGLHPSVQLLPLRWNAVALWQALGDGQEPPDAEESEVPVYWLVWRTAGQPHFRSLPAQEAEALRGLGRGATFGEVCAAAGDEAVPALVGYLHTWLAQEVLTRQGFET